MNGRAHNAQRADVPGLVYQAELRSDPPPLLSTRFVVMVIALLLLAMLSVVGTRMVFRSLQDGLSAKSHNEDARLIISDEIVGLIGGIEKHSYYLSTLTSMRAYIRMETQALGDIAKVRHAIEVLKAGGTVTRELELNLVGQSEYQHAVHYHVPRDRRGFVMEWIEIASLLDTLELNLATLKSLIAEREDIAQRQAIHDHIEVDRRIGLFVKGLHSQFSRLRENANRSFVESSQNLKLLEAQLVDQRRIYRYMEQAMVALIVVFAVGASLVLVRRIKASNARLMATWRDLSHEQALFKSITYTMFDGLYVVDASGEVLLANPSAAKLLGCRDDELLGLGLNNFLTTPPDPGYQGQAEAIAQRCDGSRFPVSISQSPLEDANGDAAGRVFVFRDITQAKMHEDKLYRIAHYDAATGLPNRLLILEKLDRALAAGTEPGRLTGFLLMAVNNLNTINESFGHDVGDEVITQLAERFHSLAETGWLGRWSGTEFTLVMESLQHVQDTEQAAELLINLLEWPIKLRNGLEVYVGGRIGISLAPLHGETAATIIRNADTALHQAKLSTAPNYHVYAEALTLEARRGLKMDAAMRQGLQGDEFTLYYQPLIDVRDERIAGAEVLVRWRHPEMGMVPPASFIPIAENSGFIITLGQWILRTACEQYVAWRDAGLQLDTLAVNLSPRQFQQRDLRTSLIDIIRLTGMPPEHLELELTEGAMMKDGEASVDILTSLKALGVRLAIDDFGTGYSSLTYLKQFPVDKLKIDQSFVRGLPDDLDDRAIVDTVVSMGRAMRLEVLAEGVETAGQADYLRQVGCDTLQGYRFSRPVPAAEFASMLAAQDARGDAGAGLDQPGAGRKTVGLS